MTTTATQLADIVASAGDEGKIRHTSGSEYIVSVDNSGEYRLSSSDDGFWNNEPISTFMPSGWSVINDSQNVREFFDSIPVYSVVQVGNTAQNFVYMGYTYRHDENQISLVGPNGSEAYLGADTHGNENRWRIVESTSIDSSHVEALKKIQELRREYASQATELGQIRAMHTNVIDDVQIINDKLCEYAVDKGYCPEFEEVIDRWNESLSVIELQGRPRDFDVRIKLGNSYAHQYLSISARTASEAREIVEAMSMREVMQTLVEAGCYFDDLEFEIEDIS